MPSVTSSARAFTGLLLHISCLLFPCSEVGAASSSCCIITYFILSKELKLRVEQRKQINNLNAHVIDTHKTSRTAGSTQGAEETHFSRSCSPRQASFSPQVCRTARESRAAGRAGERAGGSAAPSPAARLAAARHMPAAVAWQQQSRRESAPWASPACLPTGSGAYCAPD